MDPVRPIPALPQAAAVEAPRPVERPAAASVGGRAPLDPAVSIDLSGKAPSDAVRAQADPPRERRDFAWDAEARTLVLSVSDSASGEVVIRIPDEVVLKARAYARQPNPPAGEHVATSA